ncbi:MAG TPA: thiol peroxidase [Rhabdochlamydiaceae bacterium]|nr:thiol peroxidase [Rhabdochlamydiaceae bacterium]
MAQITLKGNAIHTNGQLPALQTKAPDFQLVDQDLNNRSLKDFKGKRKILSLVPSLDTPVCSLSAKKFNEAMKNHPDIVVLVISADSPFAQKRVCGAEGLKNIVTLSMMRSKDFAKDYGVLIVDGPLAGICARAVVVLDENDHVIYEQLVPEIAQEPDYEAALKAATT